VFFARHSLALPARASVRRTPVQVSNLRACEEIASSGTPSSQ
jgi:hypothetical protein